jgi:hypothetical protein
MMGDSLSYAKSPVYDFSTDRIAGLRLLLIYALSHHYARSWIAPLTILLQRGRLGPEVKGG